MLENSRPGRRMARPNWLTLAAGILLLGPAAAPQQARPVREAFLVSDRGTALLGSDGTEINRLDSVTSAAGALSPDGRWVAFIESRPVGPPDGKWRAALVIQSRAQAQERKTVPQVWRDSGSSFLPLWSSDSQRILICEQGQNEDGTRGSSFRMYDLNTNAATELKLPAGCWPSDWSLAGNRLLMNPVGTQRVAWVKIDGTGAPEFITSEDDVAYGARLSPDGRKILCMLASCAASAEGKSPRLTVVELATKKQTVIDKPGHTHGYCWSADGSKVAYTWQAPLRHPAETPERRTYLFTCKPDGSDRQTVTLREYLMSPKVRPRNAVAIFFQVLDWK